MSGVSVDMGGGSLNANALAELLAGNAGVQQRVQEYQKAKAEAETALANLQLGQSAKDAYADAQAKQAQANDALAQAQATLASAQQQLDDAKAQAARIAADVEAQKKAADSDIASQKASFQSWMDEQTSMISNAKASADKALAEAQDQRQAMLDAQAEAKQAIADAQSAQQKAAEAEAEFRQKAQVLAATIAQVGK